MFGATFKIFNEVPYFCIHFGGIELNGDFESTYIHADILYRLGKINDDNKIISGVIQSNWSYYIEFALHSKNKDMGIPQQFRIKGGLIMPFQKFYSVNGILSRIVIEVPIGGILHF